ncbi:hypothetical protein L7F22_012274 [Adiantum nelumboides]|nr:hypothetical protein [Adiantum nelumboides]
MATSQDEGLNDSRKQLHKASDLFVRALENENIKYIFGIPGEENLDLLNSLKGSSIKVILTRHEQAAGFMAATLGRLTGKVGVCLSTLGPGATNFATAAAFAQLAGFPMMMITGQKPIRKSKQGSFQIVDIVENMRPITKFTKQIADGELIPSLVREAVRQAEEERPGAVHLELPEDIAGTMTEGELFPVHPVRRPIAEEKAIKKAVEMIEAATNPLLLVGAGANRKRTQKIFIDGLEPNLKDDVHKFDPATLDVAIAYVERLGDNRRQGRNFFPGERSFNNNRSFQRDNRGRYSQNQQRSSQNYQPARQSSPGQFFGNQSSGQQSFRPRFSGQATPSQTGSSSNGLGIKDGFDKIGDVMTVEIFKGRLASTSSAPFTSQSSRSGLCTICGGNHRWYECPKRPNPSTTRRNTNMESCPETEECSTSTQDKGKQAVRAVRISKVVSVLMLNANTNVSVPVNLSNQVLSLLGFVGNHPLNVLVDSGCSTNFVSIMLVSKLRLPTQQSVEAFQVELADGSYLQCNKKVQQLEFQIQDYKVLV